MIAVAALVSAQIYGRSLIGTTETSVSILSCSSLSKVTIVEGNVSSNPESSTATFLVVEADYGSPFEGMNGSAFHIGVSWPVIHVIQNQTVVIHIINCASSEPHGFAIVHYFDGGVTLPPEQSYTLTFVASQKGNFTMYCNTFCAIHPYMQNGKLIVS